jgi:hypothetical protein
MIISYGDDLTARAPGAEVSNMIIAYGEDLTAGTEDLQARVE